MNMDSILDNHYVKSIVIMFLVLYIATVRPELPSYIKNTFENPIFRIVVLFFIVMKANREPFFALMIAMTFVITLSYLSTQKAKEAFQSVKKIKN